MKKFTLLFWLFTNVGTLLGIFSYFGITYPLLNKWFVGTPAFIKILILLLPIALSLKYLKEIKNLWTSLAVQNELDRISSQTSIQKIELVLPSNYLLNYWLKRVQKRAKDWGGDDTRFISFNFYLDFNNGKWEIPSVQAIFFSDWKNEEGWFYEGKTKGENFEEKTIVNTNKAVIHF